MRKSLAGALIVAVVIASGFLLTRTHSDPRPALSTALRTAPTETHTANFTDWSGLRRALAPSLGAAGSVRSDSAAATRSEFLDRAYDNDLSAVSVLGPVAQEMVPAYGWSVFDARWEMFAQSDRGAVIVVALRPDVEDETVLSGLRAVGYEEPSARPSSGGVWTVSDDATLGTVSALSPQLANAAYLADQGLVVFSDAAGYVRRTTHVIEGSARSFGDRRVVSETSQAIRDSDVAVVRSPRQGCRATSFEKAADGDRAEAERFGDAAGGLSAHAGLGLGLRQREGRQQLVVTMRFGSSATAQDQIASRARLARGEAVGQGGSFGERFANVTASTRAGVGVLALAVSDPAEGVLSDLGSGPLLFAWCGAS